MSRLGLYSHAELEIDDEILCFLLKDPVRSDDALIATVPLPEPHDSLQIAEINLEQQIDAFCTKY